MKHTGTNEANRDRALEPQAERLLGYALRDLLRANAHLLRKARPRKARSSTASMPEVLVELQFEGHTFSLSRRPGRRVETLSEREKEIVRLVARGLVNREIAERLGLSPHTVAAHLRRIFRKLDVTSRVSLARWTHLL